MLLLADGWKMDQNNHQLTLLPQNAPTISNRLHRRARSNYDRFYCRLLADGQATVENDCLRAAGEPNKHAFWKDPKEEKSVSNWASNNNK
jgi:hypothetical protein